MRAPTGWQGRASTFMRRNIPGGGGGRTNLVAPVSSVRRPTTTPGAAPSPRFATLVIAASSTSADGKAAADFVCTGTNDYTTWQDALDALVDVAQTPKRAGKLLALEGDYSMGAGNVVVPVGSDRGITIEGMGWGTYLSTNGSHTAFEVAGTHLQLKNMTIHGAADGVQITGPVSSGLTVEQVYFDSCAQAIDWADAGSAGTIYYLKILDNIFNGCGAGGPVVDLTDANGNHLFKLDIQGNTWDNTDTGQFDLKTSASAGSHNFAVMYGNHFDQDVWLEDWNYLALGPNTSDDGASDLSIKDIFDFVASGNIFKSYTEVNAPSGKAVAANIPAF
jgi:hypothetical protein